VLLGTVGSVLSGSVWGDHCSPISDTTILSSMASGCDHLAHVRTQIPYALVGGAAAILVGTLPTAFGAPVWIMLPVGALAIVAVVRLVGRPVVVAG
jgi:Na+/H+ antiporter NhaC